MRNCDTHGVSTLSLRNGTPRLPARGLSFSPIRLISVPYSRIHASAYVSSGALSAASPYECPLRTRRTFTAVLWSCESGGCEEEKWETQWTDSCTSRGQLSTFVASIFTCRYFLKKEIEGGRETKNITRDPGQNSTDETWKPGKTWKKMDDSITEVQIAVSFVCGTNKPYKTSRAHSVYSCWSDRYASPSRTYSTMNTT